MDFLEIDRSLVEPVEAYCTDTDVIVTLADGARVVTPLWWYPTLVAASKAQRDNIELSPFGVHWPDIDEDLSIEGMLKGRRARNAVPTTEAAA